MGYLLGRVAQRGEEMNMWIPDTSSLGGNRGQRLAGNLWVTALAVGVLAACAFCAFPQIDLMVSGAFHVKGGAFSGQSLGWVLMLRTFFRVHFYLWIAASLAGLFITRDRTRTWLRLAFIQWLFLAICIALGPGIVTNAVLKDHWGRARPREVVEFGGSKAFTRPLLPTNQCTNNCSFIAGEAASNFMPFYAASLLVPEWATVLLTAGTLCGLAAGLVRVSQGAHFLSDVIFAGVIMALTAAGVYRARFGRVPHKKG
jgi:lipid A 4'-phosphatase